MSEQIKGKLEILNNASDVAITLQGQTARLTVGDSGKRGIVDVKDQSGTSVLHVNGKSATVRVGGSCNAGVVEIRDDANKQRIKLDGGSGNIRVKNAAGNTLLQFNSTYAALFLGGQGNEGDLVVRDHANKERIKLDGGEGIWNNHWSGARAGELPCRFSFDVQWVNTSQHHTVRVRTGPGGTNMTLWDTFDSGGVAAHEVGHMMGHEDEYSASNCPDRSPVNTGTVMDNNTNNVPARLMTGFASNIGCSVVAP